MDLLVVEKHAGEGAFPLFPKGTPVQITGGEDEEYTGWYPCSISDHNTYIPDVYVTDGHLVQDYNPSELVAEKGQMVALIRIVYEWLYVKDIISGKIGWIPASKVISV